MQADRTMLDARIDSVLRGIDAAAAQVQSEYPTATGAGEPIRRIVSALAEGSDRIVAERAIGAGYELACPLPFAREEYARDFADEASRLQFANLLERAKSVTELHGWRAAPDIAYEFAGRVMLSQSDVVIAIWNGEPAGGQGGTGQMVREAIALGIPVIWVNARVPHACSLFMRRKTSLETTECSKCSECSVSNDVGLALAPYLRSARELRTPGAPSCGSQAPSQVAGDPGRRPQTAPVAE